MTTDTTTSHTTCPYCGVGCGVEVSVCDGRVQPVKGIDNHPANYGRLCVKGSALHETLDHDERLLTPLIHGEPASWDAALQAVADKMKQVIADHGPDAVAFYGSGQLLTEDYYVANKLMKGFIGSANTDTNSRLCMASAVVAHKRAFGSDTVPGCYEDLEAADLLVLVGSNTAWAHPIVYQRIAAAKAARPEMKIVVIDPRRTATCDIADLHLPIRPGSDTLLFNGLLRYLHNERATDEAFLQQHCEGWETTLDATQYDEPLAQTIGVTPSALAQFFYWFKETPRTVTVFSQGVNQSRDGSDKANAIINVHLATGRIGKPGACPFSITGQPNAMGGREVGGLANQLAAHMDFGDDDADRVQRFWQSPNIAKYPGLKAVELFQAVAEGHIKFLWIMSTNPLVSMPDADTVRTALQHCEMVVVSDCMRYTDTTAAADILLPAASWGEKNGTVTNSERRISRQRPFLNAPGEARPDWWIVSQVGQRLGFSDAFNYQHPVDIFDEHARLSGFENHGQRDFDLSGLIGLSQTDYDAMLPVQWPVNAKYPQGRARFFDDGRFYTPNGKARLIPVRAQAPLSSSGDTLLLNTGRIRDHWHTMTRTGKSARLTQHSPEPYVDMHPIDAAQRGIIDGQIVALSNTQARSLLRVRITKDERQRPGELFAPMHWTSRYASRARVCTLIASDRDPHSGQPALKAGRVNVSPYPARYYGFLLSRRDIGPLPCDYWAYNRSADYHAYELADAGSADGLLQTLQRQFPGIEWLRVHDNAEQHYRLVGVEQGQLQCLLFTHRDHRVELGNRRWLLECFTSTSISDPERLALLAGRPREGSQDSGAIICSCFQVGETAIRQAIANGCDTTAALGKALKCGTNCGSCLPELTGLIDTQCAITAESA